ncbi:MAG: GIY-YIG nuclease family protein [Deltaproteobacteria bacterium]|nr:GIY-YIG nuclease family protein [Deltaproteobacteria bacterium]
MTNNLIRRIWEHKNNMVDGFTRRYSVHQLVWYELHEGMTEAITREKQLKNWKRDWKIALIVAMNPDWVDLYEGIV